MQSFLSPDHRLRDALTELHGGRLVRPFEAPFRVELVAEVLRERGHRIDIPPPCGLETARHVHDLHYLDFLATAWQRWKADGYEGEAIATCFPVRRMRQKRPPRDIDGALGHYAFAAETSITEGTWRAACSAMESAVAAADHVGGGTSAAFALCRPPGHHASIDQFGGYCFLNNAAIAAQHLRDRGAARVAVLDVDFHHGNGTQDIFWNRGDVFFASLHGDPEHAFPYFLGFADEIGEGAGEGSTANYPLPRGTAYGPWALALDHALDRIAAHGAEALVVSLGVDTFERDPISFFRLTSEDFLACGERIGRRRLPTVFCMEGGYGVEEIGINAVNVLDGFEQA